VTSIAIITTSRADAAHLRPLVAEIDRHEAFKLTLLASGAALAPTFGTAGDAWSALGHPVDERVESLLDSDTDVGMAKTIGIATLGLSETLSRLRPDLLVVTADRYEMLAPASVALALRIPVVHIEGGERSEGAIDQQVRDALTMMSHVHLVTTRSAAARLRAMGEEPWRIHHVGAGSLDLMRQSPVHSREQLAAILGVDVSRETVVVAHHPLTIAQDTAEELPEVVAALQSSGRPLICCYPNADAGNRRIIHAMKDLVRDRRDSGLFTNLEPAVYWSILRHAGCLVGNSSSGIMESASIPVPAVDIGDRQKGRERARNVLTVCARREEIAQAIERGAGRAFRDSLEGLVNPYGDGSAAPRAVRVLAALPPKEVLLRKAISVPVDQAELTLA